MRVITWIIKACAPAIFNFFSPNGSILKAMKNAFYFIWKAVFVLKLFKLLEFFPFLSHFSDSKGQMQVE